MTDDQYIEAHDLYRDQYGDIPVCPAGRVQLVQSRDYAVMTAPTWLMDVRHPRYDEDALQWADGHVGGWILLTEYDPSREPPGRMPARTFDTLAAADTYLRLHGMQLVSNEDLVKSET